MSTNARRFRSQSRGAGPGAPGCAQVDWSKDLQRLTSERSDAILPRPEDLNSFSFTNAEFDALNHYYFAVNANGTFTIEDVPPGEYALHLHLTAPMAPPPPGYPGPDPRREIGSLSIQVMCPEHRTTLNAPAADLGVISLELKQP